MSYISYKLLYLYLVNNNNVFIHTISQINNYI